jgi:hypothetical protein
MKTVIILTLCAILLAILMIPAANAEEWTPAQLQQIIHDQIKIRENQRRIQDLQQQLKLQQWPEYRMKGYENNNKYPNFYNGIMRLNDDQVR